MAHVYLWSTAVILLIFSLLALCMRPGLPPGPKVQNSPPLTIPTHVISCDRNILIAAGIAFLMGNLAAPLAVWVADQAARLAAWFCGRAGFRMSIFNGFFHEQYCKFYFLLQPVLHAASGHAILCM